MKFHPCKIIVIEKDYKQEIIDAFLKEPDKMKICNLVEVGQEFLVTNPFEMPENMCHSAWADIRPFILCMASGGQMDMMKNPKSGVAICSDPFRPVFFQIERLD